VKHECRTAVMALCMAMAAAPLGAQELASIPPGSPTPASTSETMVGTIVGTVTDSRQGMPLANVQIGVIGTTLGSVTDNDGKFRIPGVPVGAVQLRIRLIGYSPIDRTVTVAEGGTATLIVAMDVKPLALDALVVTGTAVGTKAREVGNAIGHLDVGNQAESPAVNVQQLLGQKVSGVVVQPAAGMVGAGSSITIRGAASLSLQTQPIIYVDGVRVDNSSAQGPSIRQGRTSSRLNDFNPEDIASIEIIKGPSAATLYGTEASNGVIQILTKRGQAGKPSLDVALRYGGNFMRNAEKRFGMTYGMNPITQKVDSFSVFQLHRDQYEGRELFNTGPLSSANLSLAGGSDITRYYISGEMSRNEGIVEYNWETVNSARANLTIVPTKDWKIDGNMSFNQHETRYAQAADQFGIWDEMIWSSPSLLSSTTKGWRYATPAVAASIDSRSLVHRFTGGVDLVHTPLPWFTQQVKLGLDFSQQANQILFPKVPDGEVNLFGARVGGQKNLEDVTIGFTTMDYSATARKEFGAVSTATSTGAQFYARHTRSVTALGDNFPTPEVTTIGGAASTTAGETYVENKTLGFYIQETLGWRNRIFVTGAVRGDANSAFGANYKAAYYPKASGTWVVSEEPFFENNTRLRSINTLRLRASWGQAGQQPDAFAALRLYTPVTGPGALPALTTFSIGNPELRPERGSELDFGFDMTALNDRVSLTYTHFNRTTTDAIVNVPVYPATGFPGNQILNLGRTSNWGNELELSVKMLNAPNLAWDIGANFATVKNLVEDLGGVTLQNYRVGFPITSIFMVRVVDAKFDAAGKLTGVLCDGGPDQSPTTCDVAPTVYWGVGQPTKSGSISNSVTLWKNLRLHALAEFQLGQNSVNGDIRDANTNFQNTAKIWTQAPDPIFAAYQTVAPKAPLGFYDASFAKLREVSASYNLSPGLAHRMRADRASINAAWRNVAILWQATKELNSVKIFDPEVRSPGLGNSYTYQTTLPPTSQIVVTARLSY
jgi:TonB-linked SusC/RagA family outer membrane protein